LAGEGISINHIDVGGGLGIRYGSEQPPEPNVYVKSLLDILGARPQKLLLEPGRSLVGNAGVLLAKVEYIKSNGDKNFLVVDAAMNDLMRPALYDAFHEILPLEKTNAKSAVYDVVGPVCETGDFLGMERTLNVGEGDLIAIMSAGAYGMSMSSNYNTRPRAAEIWVDKNKYCVIRERESVAQLLAAEKLPS
jgi:diaminopimelate decarboxylase